MRIPVALATVALTAAVALTGCQEAQDAAQEAAGDAACSVAGSAVDEAGRQAGQAVDEIGADPESAEQELRAVREALDAAAATVDGDVKARVEDARDAVDRLRGQAEEAVAGEVDTAAVDEARGELDQAVEDVKNLC